MWILNQDQLEALVLALDQVPLDQDLPQQDQVVHQLLDLLQLDHQQLDPLQLGQIAVVLEGLIMLALALDHLLTIVQLEVVVIHQEETIKSRLKKKN